MSMRPSQEEPTELKLVFVHLMRTGGTWINSLFRRRFHSEHFHDSWSQHLGRDWTADELVDFSRAPGPCYVHNHIRNWTPELVRLFRRAGFTCFSFLRHPGDQLCSLFFWLQQVCPDSTISLNEFLKLQLAGESWQDVSQCDWSIPEFIDELDLVAEFSVKNVSALVDRCTNIPVTQTEYVVVNSSENPGYKRCVDNGRVNGEVCRLLQQHRCFRKYESLTHPAVKGSQP